MIKTILRSKPYLTIYNYNKITDRVQAKTNGDMFFAYNRLKNKIELHSVTSFKISPAKQSKQATIEKPLLNDWILKDIKVRDNRRFLAEKKDESDYRDQLFEDHAALTENLFIDQGMENIKDILGRK